MLFTISHYTEGTHEKYTNKKGVKHKDSLQVLRQNIEVQNLTLCAGRVESPILSERRLEENELFSADVDVSLTGSY